MNEKILLTIGMACRAGKVVSGEDLIRKAINKNKTKLIIVAQDASLQTKDGYINMCKFYNVKYIEFSTKDMLGKYIGKATRTAIAINDEGFKKSILGKIEELENK